MFSRQRKAQNQQAQLRSSLTPGQRIMTTSGVFGTVTGVEGDRMWVEIAPDTEVEMVVAALAKVVPSESPDDLAELETLDSTTDDDEDVDLTKAEPEERISLDKHVGEEPDQRPGNS